MMKSGRWESLVGRQWTVVQEDRFPPLKNDPNSNDRCHSFDLIFLKVCLCLKTFFFNILTPLEMCPERESGTISDWKF